MDRDRQRLIVGTDGSPAAEKAVARAAQLAVDGEHEVVVVHVMTRMATFLSDLPDDSYGDVRRRVRELLDEVWARPVRELGVPYRTRLESGAPPDRLLSLATEEGAKCVVVGSGRNATPGALGSTVLKLQQQTDHRVVLVT